MTVYMYNSFTYVYIKKIRLILAEVLDLVQGNMHRLYFSSYLTFEEVHAPIHG